MHNQYNTDRPPDFNSTYIGPTSTGSNSTGSSKCNDKNVNRNSDKLPTGISPTLVSRNHKLSKWRLVCGFVSCLCRTVCLDLPLLFILCIYAIIVHTEWIGDKYLIPLIHLQKFDNPEQSLTYYHRACTLDDQTTYDTTDLLVDITNASINNEANSSKIDKAVEKMLYHGVTIIPNLISEPTATKLRDYIIEQNTNQNRKDFIEVIENDFRYSFGIHVDEHPIIAVALEEILLHNPALVTYLEAIMGSDPAVVEFTAISQVYGATDQYWHQDGECSSARSCSLDFLLCNIFSLTSSLLLLRTVQKHSRTVWECGKIWPLLRAYI
jgi:hypothetical protein